MSDIFNLLAPKDSGAVTPEVMPGQTPEELLDIARALLRQGGRAEGAPMTPADLKALSEQRNARFSRTKKDKSGARPGPYTVNGEPGYAVKRGADAGNIASSGMGGRTDRTTGARYVGPGGTDRRLMTMPPAGRKGGQEQAMSDEALLDQVGDAIGGYPLEGGMDSSGGEAALETIRSHLLGGGTYAELPQEVLATANEFMMQLLSGEQGDLGADRSAQLLRDTKRKGRPYAGFRGESNMPLTQQELSRRGSSVGQ